LSSGSSAGPLACVIAAPRPFHKDDQESASLLFSSTWSKLWRFFDIESISTPAGLAILTVSTLLVDWYAFSFGQKFSTSSPVSGQVCRAVVSPIIGLGCVLAYLGFRSWLGIWSFVQESMNLGMGSLVIHCRDEPGKLPGSRDSRRCWVVHNDTSISEDGSSHPSLHGSIIGLIVVRISTATANDRWLHEHVQMTPRSVDLASPWQLSSGW